MTWKQCYPKCSSSCALCNMFEELERNALIRSDPCNPMIVKQTHHQSKHAARRETRLEMVPIEPAAEPYRRETEGFIHPQHKFIWRKNWNQRFWNFVLFSYIVEEFISKSMQCLVRPLAWCDGIIFRACFAARAHLFHDFPWKYRNKWSILDDINRDSKNAERCGRNCDFIVVTIVRKM